MVKKVLKKLFNKIGYTLVANHNIPKKNMFTMNRALARCKGRIKAINAVIDVGASDGRWSMECMEVFDDAQYLLVEAQKSHKPKLTALAQSKPEIDYVIAVAGPEDGEVFFDDSQLFGGQTSDTNVSGNFSKLPQICLDNEVKRKGLVGPYVLKLDTHGYEVPILEGAKEILSNASLVIIETYNFKLTSNSLKYYEMCSYMERLGFSPIENVDFMLRKKDGAFWQMDTFFIPSNNQVFEYNKYE